MKGPSFDQIMMLGGLGLAGLVIYEIWTNQASISAAIQNALNPVNMYQQQGYYCPSGGVPGPTGLCPNGQPAINQSQFNQIASMSGGCSDGSIVNPATGRCANGSVPMGGYGAGALGYPQTSVCNDGSQPNPVNGLCANGSIPTSVGTGVNNAMLSPYGAPQYVSPTITGGQGIPGQTTFTDPTTGQVYDPTTGQLLTPGGSYNTPSLASPYTSIFPVLNPLQGGGIGCADGSQPNAIGQCANGQQAISLPVGQQQSQQPVATTITTPNQQTGTMSCADGSSPVNGQCANGQQPTTMLPANTPVPPTGAVPVTAGPTPAPAPAPVTSTPPVTQTSTQPVATTSSQQQFVQNFMNQQQGLNRISGQQGGGMTRSKFGYVGYQSEGAMIAAQAFGHTPRDPNRASVTSYSSVRPKIGNSPITSEVFGRRFFTQTPIYVSNTR